MLIPFSKYSGCGNDFIVIDNRKFQLTFSQSTITKLCHRQQGIGADGLIFLETSRHVNISYRMRIFNADGSEAEMCGNGLRCLAHFIRTRETPTDSFSIETMHQPMDISFSRELVNVAMPSPSASSTKKLLLSHHEFLLHCIDTGVPHAVIFTDDIEHASHFTHAPLIRFHDAFKPQGTNVNFATLLSDNSVAVRTYERGVEKETLACGTGAVAVALIASQVKKLPAPIKIRTRSGDCLEINFHKDHHHFKHLVMTGPAIKTFDGFFDLDKFQLMSSSSIQ